MRVSQGAIYQYITGMQVFFAHPRAPWKSGPNENTNGLIRQYFPTGADLSQVSKDETELVRGKLIDLPQKVLNDYKSSEVFNDLVALKA